MTERVSVADAVGRTLVDLGVAYAFGVVGSGNLRVTNALVDGGVPYVGARHEMGAACMADAFSRATGSCLAFNDADDLWMPHKLARQIQLLSDECGFVFADFYRSESPENPGTPMLLGYSAVAEGAVFSNLLRENFVSTPTVLVRKELLAHAGIFKPRLIGGQDFDLWLRLAKHTKFGWAREPLVFMRKHEGNISSSRPYPYYHARVWEELLREHSTESSEDLAYIKLRYGRSLYDAGRHAVRLMDQPMARHHFGKAWKVGFRRALVGFWYLLSRLPHGVLNFLLETKRRGAGKVSAATVRQ